MKRISIILPLLFSITLVSCGPQKSPQTAADAVSSGEQSQTTQETVQADAPKQPVIAPECKRVIRQMVTKQEGGQQYLLDDSTLWQVMPDGQVQHIKQLDDVVDNYSLIPSTDVVIHYTNNKIMLTHIASGTELFNLTGDSTHHAVMFTPDNKEMATRNADGTYNVWIVPNRFSGIQLSETVQDFMNRQSADYKMSFNIDTYAIAFSGDHRAAIASDDMLNNKIGLIYYMDQNQWKNQIKSLARTNSHITHLAISASSSYVAAVDEKGQLYVTSTNMDQKGFKVYARSYTNTRNVKFVGDNVLAIEPERLVLIDSATGNVLWTRETRAVSCYAPSAEQLLCSTGDTIEEIDGKTGKLNRTLFFNDKTYGILTGANQLSGSADAKCLITK
ncbi:MAG: hypothetical protein IIY06_04240 [Proteobacteria bacterium]|jgi:hypothetical protein|nr:hypothetical protein [Pseudomonadota bacterium]